MATWIVILIMAMVLFIGVGNFLREMMWDYNAKQYHRQMQRLMPGIHLMNPYMPYQQPAQGQQEAPNKRSFFGSMLSIMALVLVGLLVFQKSSSDPILENIVAEVNKEFSNKTPSSRMHKAVEEAYSAIEQLPNAKNNGASNGQVKGNGNSALASSPMANQNGAFDKIEQPQLFSRGFDTGFTVQVMSLPNSVTIEEWYRRLVDDGYPARIQDVLVDGTIYYRLLVGNEPSKEELKSAFMIASKMVDQPSIRSIESLKKDGGFYAP